MTKVIEAALEAEGGDDHRAFVLLVHSVAFNAVKSGLSKEATVNMISETHDAYRLTLMPDPERMN
tara:strand:+ start:1369 stop:1563 length:195 start_codon:yes stop_codon:yes gene_type:complete